MFIFDRTERKSEFLQKSGGGSLRIEQRDSGLKREPRLRKNVKYERIFHSASIGETEFRVQGEFSVFRRGWNAEGEGKLQTFSGTDFALFLAGQLKFGNAPDNTDGSGFSQVADREQSFFNEFPRTECVAFVRQVAAFSRDPSGDCAQIGEGVFSGKRRNELAERVFHEIPVSSPNIGDDARLLEVVELSGPCSALCRLSGGGLQENDLIPGQKVGESADAECLKIFFCELRDDVESSIVSESFQKFSEEDGFAAFEDLLFIAHHLDFEGVERIRLFSQNFRIEFIHPEALFCGTAPDEGGTAHAGPACQMGKSPFAHHNGFRAVFLPEFEPVAPLLRGSPVEVAVDGVDFADASGMMIDDAGGIDAGDDSFRDQGLCATLPEVGGEFVFRDVPPDGLRVLVSVISGGIVVHGIHDDAGEILIAADGVFRKCFVACGDFRRIKFPAELASVGQGQGGEHALPRAFPVIVSEISGYAGGAVVVVAGQMIEPEFACAADFPLNRKERVCYCAFTGSVDDQRAQMQNGSVQKEVASLDFKFTESKCFGIKFIDGFSISVQRKMQSVEVFRAVDIPQFRVSPRG